MRKTLVVIFAVLTLVLASSTALRYAAPTASSTMDSGGRQGIRVELYPGVNVTGYQPLLFIVHGADPQSTRLCFKVAFIVNITPAYFEHTPFIERYAESSVMCLKPLSEEPLHTGNSVVFLVPGVPADTLLFNVSKLNVVNGRYKIRAWMYVNITVKRGEKYDVVYKARIYYQPRANTTPLPIFLNTSLAYILDASEKPVFCAAVLHGLPLRHKPVLVIRYMPSGSEVSIEPSREWSIPSLSSIARAYDKIVEKLIESFVTFVEPDSMEKPSPAQPGISYYCYTIDLKKMGFGFDSNMLVYLDADGVTSDAIALYPRGKGPKTLIIDPGLPYALQLSNPRLDAFESSLRKWGLWASNITWAKLHRIYSPLYHYIRSAWDYTPLPYWGYITSITDARIVANVSLALRELERGSYDIVILSGWWFRLPYSWPTLVRTVARMAVEGRASVIATGLSLSRLSLGNGYYLGAPLPLDHVYGGLVSSALADLGASLYQSVAGVNESLAVALADLPAPALAPVKASLTVTRAGFLELGFVEGYSVTLNLPLDARLKKLGFRGYGSLAWLPLYHVEPARITALLSDKVFQTALKTLVYNLTRVFYPGFDANLAAEAVSTSLAIAPRILSSIASGEGVEGGILANVTLPLLGSSWLEASYQPLGLELYKISLGPRFLLVGDDSIILELPLCSGARIIYSSLPLEIDSPSLAVSGPALLARLVNLAARRVKGCQLFHSIFLDSRIAATLQKLIDGDIVTGVYTVFVPPEGFTRITICTGNVNNAKLAVIPANSVNLVLLVNGSVCKPLSVSEGVTVYRLERGCVNVTVRARKGSVMPVKLYLIVYGAAPGVVTKTVTTTTTTTKTVYRNITIPVIVYRNITTTTTIVKTLARTLTKTVTRFFTRTVTSVRVVNKTLVKFKPITVVSTTTVRSIIKSTVTRSLVLTKTVKLSKTIVKTLTLRVTARKGAPVSAQLLYLALGLAAGAAVGYVVPRVILKARG